MSAEPDYHAEMRLPPGVTCADCKHIERCVGFGFSLPGCTSCDFWPNRFVRRALENKP
jgi:hypothetical protein